MTQKLLPKYDTKTYYAITIQPDDKLQHANLPIPNRILKFRSYYYSLFQDFDYDYYINIEVSEPMGSLQQNHIGGRLHLHGIIKFKKKSQILSFLLKHIKILTYHSRLEISAIHDHESWLNYIDKQHVLSPELKTLSNYADISLLINQIS